MHQRRNRFYYAIEKNFKSMKYTALEIHLNPHAPGLLSKIVTLQPKAQKILQSYLKFEQSTRILILLYLGNKNTSFDVMQDIKYQSTRDWSK